MDTVCIMKRLKKNIIPSIIGVMIFSQAYSDKTINADIKNYHQLPSQNFSWLGPYIGGLIGGAWGHSNLNTDTGALTDTSYFATTENINSVNQSGSLAINTREVIGGGQIGNNWLLNKALYGVSLDFESFHLKGSNVQNMKYPSDITNYTLQTSLNTDWLFTARGRLGLIANAPWPLIYATGGLALTELYVSNSFNDTDSSHGIGGASSSRTKAGYTVGGGVEVPLTKNFTVNGEFLYVNFGSISVSSSINGNLLGVDYTSPFVTLTNLTANLFRVGLNYKI